MAAPTLVKEPLPSALKRLFHNYRPETIDLERHSELVIMTVATHGEWHDLVWMVQHYGLERIGEVVAADIAGAKELPYEVANFWSVRLWGKLLTPPTELARWRPTIAVNARSSDA
jgi:hypothetical protein